MKILIPRLLALFFAALVFTFAANGQDNAARSSRGHDSGGAIVLKATGKVATIIVGSAGKAVWTTTKFTAKHVVKPVLLNAAPKTALFLLKKSAITTKYVLPVALKLALL